MNEKFNEQFDALITKYTELLLGDSNEELREKVEVWALYSYISKTMPALVKHWNELYPDALDEVRKVIMEIKNLNDLHRKNAEK